MPFGSSGDANLDSDRPDSLDVNLDLVHRPRRLRRTPWLRELVREHRLHASDLIWPLFVTSGDGIREPVASMPGVERVSVDLAVDEIREAADLEIPAVAVFPVTPEGKKSERGDEALSPDNLAGRTLRAVRDAGISIGLIADVALDPYTSHGHDGILRNGEIVNDETVELLVEQAILLARSGADIVAPSDMMDGRVGQIRAGLDAAGFPNTVILAYAAKFASGFYGPFRDAVGSAAALAGGDKRTYQMDPANASEALREVALDLEEGADVVMVKPGLPYLDIIHSVKRTFGVPTFAYQVSGEYSMLRGAIDQGWLAESCVDEALLAFRRAGADGILTYFAKDVARRLAAAGGAG